MTTADEVAWRQPLARLADADAAGPVVRSLAVQRLRSLQPRGRGDASRDALGVALGVARQVLGGEPAARPAHRRAPALAVRRDLEALRLLVLAVEPRVATMLLAGLEHAELRAWHGLLRRVAPRHRDATYVAVGERVSLAQWRRFGVGSGDVDPDPVGDLVDDARTDAGAAHDPVAEAHGWEPVDGPFAALGDGDGHVFAANDVVQGRIGNCYLIAALQAVAEVAPELLARLCRANANGTWTVTFPDGRRTVVSPDVVVDVHGTPVFARRPHDGEVELWPMLLEKAYAQRHGSWQAIVEGHPEDAVELLTGVPGHAVTTAHLSIGYLASWHAAGAAMIVATIAVPPHADRERWLTTDAPAPFRRPGHELARLHPGHAFVVRDVDAAAGLVTLANPWDHVRGQVVLTQAEVHSCIASMHVTDLGAHRR